MNEIKVSVIVPIYNTEKFLRKCIESILNQILKDIEIILINDGSTDESHVICKEYYEKYPQKIKYINNKNIGCSATRNLGISLAQGEYIAFVDSDDYIDKEMYEEMYKKAKKEDLDILISGVRYHYTYINPVRISDVYPKNINKKTDLLKPENRIGNCYNKLFKRELLEKTDIKFLEGIHYLEDLVFCFKLFCKAENVTYLEKSYYNYVQHGKNSIFNLENRLGGFIAFNEIYNYLKKEKYIKNKEIMKKFYENLNHYAIRQPFTILLNSKLVSKEKYQKYNKLFYEELKKLKFLPLKFKVLIHYYRSIVWLIRTLGIYEEIKKVKNNLKRKS